MWTRYSVIGLDVRASAAFWAGLTGARTEQEESEGWLTLGTPDGWSIAFQPAPHLIAPQWPGQDRPQQLHLDLRVPDLAAATARAVELGARLLRENDAWNTLADPAGHPFDLCLAEGNSGITITGVTVDCPDSHALAGFWSEVAKGRCCSSRSTAITRRCGLTLRGLSSCIWTCGFKPSTRGRPLRSSWVPLDCPVGGKTFRVFADPAGHPFCLIG